jgi:hypothetical protein
MDRPHTGRTRLDTVGFVLAFLSLVRESQTVHKTTVLVHAGRQSIPQFYSDLREGNFEGFRVDNRENLASHQRIWNPATPIRKNPTSSFLNYTSSPQTKPSSHYGMLPVSFRSVTMVWFVGKMCSLGRTVISGTV